MNRQNLWFVSLFSLILIIGVYYITLPNDIIKNNETKSVSKDIEVNINEEDKLVALRVERDLKIESTMEELQSKITSTESTIEQRNTAFEELQILNLAKGKESLLESKILDKFKIKSFVEIDNDNIKVTVSSNEHNKTIANNIMRSIQEEFKDKKYITIKFE